MGYKTEEDHIRDCREDAERKRQRILLLEREAARLDTCPVAAGGDAPDDDDDDAIAGEAYEDPKERDDEEEDDEEEDDEEMAVARELEQLDAADGAVDAEGRAEGGDDSNDEGAGGGDGNDEEESPEDAVDHLSGDKSTNDDAKEQDAGITKPEEDTATSITSSPGRTTPGSIVTPLRVATEEECTSEDPAEVAHETAGTATGDQFVNDDSNVAKESDSEIQESKLGEAASPESSKLEGKMSKDAEPLVQDSIPDANTSKEASTPAEEETAAVEERTTPKKPRNSAWQAMLQKEKEALAKQKKLHKRGGGLVDGEAEEEDEEDQGIAGLEDFGFAVQKKNEGDNDDDVDGDANEDDLEHIVDDVSDGEGDEEAGEEARQRLERDEEKERHKDIIRRMREGYDGRCGGIASGAGGARGTLRFDQLVAADNREDAKRLGLLNDDELNSDDEGEGGAGGKGKKGGDEEDDEAVQLGEL